MQSDELDSLVADLRSFRYDNDPYLERVYLIGAPGHDIVKIGVTTSPIQTRLRQIQANSPLLLDVRWQFRGCRPAEHMLHRFFARDRYHHEWFRMSPQLQYVAERMDGFGLEGFANVRS